MAKRDYQSIIFTEVDSVTIDYDTTSTPPKKAKITFPKGDTETKRAFIIGLPGGGALFPGMDSYAKQFCQRGYVFGEFEPGNGNEFEQIAHAGCFNRFMHKHHGDYGIAGGKFFGFGISIGGAIIWGMNICLDKILTDRQFDFPVNDLYPSAKMKLRGSASMPGDVDDSLYPMIDASCVPHLDSHGNADAILPYAKAKAAIDQMNKFAPGSRLDTYDRAGHDLAGLHDVIMAKTITFFSGVMGIAPVNVPA